jgi:regulation of enolase protein 1 (concanavalin A-like superfamily)
MRKGSFTYLRSWRSATVLVLGLVILISGFAHVSKPIFDIVQSTTENVSSNFDQVAEAAEVTRFPLNDVPSNYCALSTTHFGGNESSRIFLTIANLDANSIYVEIQSATASPVDLLLVENIVAGGIVSDPTTPSAGVIRRTVTWANPPTDVILNVLWSQADFGGNWQLSQAPITVPFAAVCPSTPPPPSSAYCERPTTHFGGNPPSGILLTIANLDDNSIFVEIKSNTASPVDLLQIENIVGGIVSDPTTPSTGVIRRTVTWANPPTDVILNVLWSHEDFGGNWQLSQAPITVPFAAICDGSPPPPNQPTTNTPDPTCLASEVISIYGSTYNSIATNFDPNWGQSGHNQVNPNFDPGTGNVVLAYPNFNYQGTELTPTNASAMEFFHVDVWTNANPSATTLQVSPINFGSGTMEFLVTIPFTQGEWTRVVLPKSAFTGMTWNDIRQLKFAANGPGSTVPVTIYLDNIFFSTSGCSTSTNITFCVDYSCVAQTPGFAAQQIFFEGGPFNGFNNLTNTGNNIWCGTFALPAGEVRYNFFYAGAAGAGGPENLSSLDGQSCVSSGAGGLKRTYSVVSGSPAVITNAWESCSSTPNCPQTIPTVAAPNPTCLQENVISLFSDSYTNVAVDTWLTVWSGATGGSIVPIAGNNTRLYNNVNFLGIETTGANRINASGMANFHIDIWTPNMTTFRVKLVDFGANGNFGGGDDTEGEIAFSPTQGGWNSYVIPMTSFQAVGLINRANIAQIILSGIPVGQGTLYVDNIYFSKANCDVPCIPSINCSNQTVTFNGQNSISLVASQLATVSSDCGIQSVTVSPNTIFSSQIGQVVTVFVTVTDNFGNTATCPSQITVTGLPPGWSANSNGIGCSNGNSVNYNSNNETWTVTSTNCYYGNSFNADAAAFAQYTLCGNGSITAQVTGVSGTSLGWAGVIMRETNAPGAKKAHLLTNMSNFSRREFRVTTNGTSFPQQFPSQNRRWLRITRSGNQFAMFISADGGTWFFVGAQNIQMNGCIEIGLAVTNYSSNSTVTASFSNVSVSGNNFQLLLNSNDEFSQMNTIDKQSLTDFNLFPNPTTGELNIELMGYNGKPVAFEVYSTIGQLLFTKQINEMHSDIERLNLSTLAKGIYLIRVTSEGLPTSMKRITLIE